MRLRAVLTAVVAVAVIETIRTAPIAGVVRVTAGPLAAHLSVASRLRP